MPERRVDGTGPDGKLLVRMRDESDRWSLEHVLVTIQQTASTAAMDIAAATICVLRNIYSGLQDRDRRWRSDWRDVAVMVNPNGPLVEAGSDGDNGQTGRKLVMDFASGRTSTKARVGFNKSRACNDYRVAILSSAERSVYVAEMVRRI